MAFRTLPVALALVLIAGSSTAALTFTSWSEPQNAAPSHAPTPSSAGKTSTTKKSATPSHTKVAPAGSGTSGTHSASKPSPKSATKAPTKIDEHATPANTPSDEADNEHNKDKASSDAAAHVDTPKPASSKSKSTSDDSALTADNALSLLTEGNVRWVNNKPQAPNTDSARREEVASGQHPMVTILTCADSRIPVERVFDRGVGDVFVIRVAGNVAGGSETGTIEYGVEHLKTPLLIVMGHTKCGAVAAAATNAPVHGFVAKLVSNIQPAVERARRANPDADEKTLSTLAVNENVWQSVFDLFKASQPIRELAAAGQLKVVGAVYDITTGKVDFLGEHPWQNELLATMTPTNATTAKPLATKADTNSHSQAKDTAKITASAAGDHDAPMDNQSDGHGTDSKGH